jgi:hypothetical protein
VRILVSPAKSGQCIPTTELQSLPRHQGAPSEGISSLKGIAAALNKRRIRAARNIGRWHPTQVARLLKLLPA